MPITSLVAKFCTGIIPMWKSQSFCREESGATSVEYAVMLALILMTMIVSIRSFGNSTSGMWTSNHGKLNESGF